MQFKCSYIKVGDLAQLVTCLPGEHESPWSDPIPHVKAWHNGTCLFFPLESGGRAILGACWSGSLADLVSSGLSESLSQKTR